MDSNDWTRLGTSMAIFVAFGGAIWAIWNQYFSFGTVSLEAAFQIGVKMALSILLLFVFSGVVLAVYIYSLRRRVIRMEEKAGLRRKKIV